MSTIIPSTFTKYEFTDQEINIALALTTVQYQFIQTQIAMLAEQHLALEPDPLNYAVFIQSEAHIKGQITALKYMLDCSDEVHVRALQQAQDQANIQSFN